MKLWEVALQYHDTLNPKLWNENNVLKPDVRQALVKLAETFIDFLEIDTSFIQDVILTGSNCNYNWNSTSDLDIHVVLSYDEFQKSCSTVDVIELFKSKKSLWNSEHDIDIKGIPTEMYVQNSNQSLPKDDALFSLGKNKWLTPPKKIENFTVDQKEINSIANPIKQHINDIIKNKNTNLKEIEALQDAIATMRKTGLDKSGQFSAENLAFKKLRNDGDIEKLYDYYSKVQDEQLSL